MGLTSIWSLSPQAPRQSVRWRAAMWKYWARRARRRWFRQPKVCRLRLSARLVRRLGSWRLIRRSQRFRNCAARLLVSACRGPTIEFATRRALTKLGFTPGKDIQILATGLAESNKRIMVMLQGKIDATLVSPDNLLKAEQKNLKLSVLLDLKDLNIYTSASDLSAKRDFLKNQRQRARSFMMAYCEAIWLGKANKNVALASFRKHMREQYHGGWRPCTKTTWSTRCRSNLIRWKKSFKRKWKISRQPWRSFAVKRLPTLSTSQCSPISIVKIFLISLRQVRQAS